MTDNETAKIAPTGSIDTGKKGNISSKKRSRLFAGIILIAYGLYRCLVMYYSSSVDQFILNKSWSSTAALVLYESGQYEKASNYWRRHYGLAFDPATSDAYRKNLLDKIEKESDKKAAYYLLADLLYSQRNYAAAASIYQRVLARNKEDYGASLGLATCLAMEGNYKESRIGFSRLFRHENNEDNPTGFLHALVLLDQLERMESRSAETYLMLAYVNRYLRIFDARREKDVFVYADKALELDGKLDEAYMCKGVMYMKKGEYDQALAMFGRAAKVNHRNADVFNRMGYVCGRLGDLEGELANYRQAVELEGDPLFAFRLGDLLLKKYGDTRQAALYFKRALDLTPNNYEFISQYGYALLLSKEYDKLLGVCVRIIELFPERPYGYKLKGDYFMAKKEYREAIACYLKSNDVAREANDGSQLDFTAFVDLGHAYEKLKKLDDAISAYRQALKIKPHDVETLYSLQFVCRCQGKYDEAYAAVKEILRLQPNHSGAQRLLSYLQRNAGRSL